MRVALVTGAGRGLGRAHALALAARGTAVVVNDSGAELDGRGGDPAVADAVAAEIEATGGTALASHHDVATHGGADGAVGRALDAFGRLDAVVNNAGILRDRSFGKLDRADFDAVVIAHLGSAAYVTRAAWPALRASGSGRVVFTSSASGLFGQFGQANYAAAKLGLVGLMNDLKHEGERHGIRVNAIAPVARTRMTEPLLPDAVKDGLGPERVSPLVAWLASEVCGESGLLLQVAAGLVTRVRLFETEPLTLPEDVAEIGDVVDELGALGPGTPFGSTGESLQRFMDAASTPG